MIITISFSGINNKEVIYRYIMEEQSNQILLKM